MKTIPSVKGTRDYYPEEMAVRDWLYQTVRRVSELFGYQEYDTPFLESIELYAAKSGEELVQQQSYVFKDRGGDFITLRPELTPSLARMIAQRQRQLVYPLRWWSWGPFWRYERPQKGRAREFFQWNIDLIGADSPEADAEMVAIAATFFKEVGLTAQEINILVGNRRLLDTQFQKIEIPVETRAETLRLIDRREKMSPEQWEAYAIEIGLTQDQVEKLKEILNNNDLWRESPELERFFQTIHALGIGEYVRFAPQIIRGLQYYTGTVFEAWDIAGEFRSLFGGGRYDNLVSDVGGESLSAVGFAMGDMVTTLLLKKYGCLPKELGQSSARVLVTLFDEPSRLASFSLAAHLREEGIPVISYPDVAKLTRQIRFADRLGIRFVVILGPDEQARSQVTIKNLATSEQLRVDQNNISQVVKQLLAGDAPS